MEKHTWPLSNPAYASHRATHVPFSELTGPVRFIADGVIVLGTAAADLVLRLIAQARYVQRVNKTMDALTVLDDRTLRDIGLSREQIPLVAMQVAKESQRGHR